jgi:hypothetical protein
MTRYNLINGEKIALTAAEEAARDAEEAAVAAEKTANEYKEKREDSYPDWKTQMDMQYWDSVNGTTTWKDLITKIKSDNPKPS